MDDAEDEMKSCRRHLAEGYRNEKQRNRDFTARVEDLENKVKEEGEKEPEPEPPARWKLAAPGEVHDRAGEGGGGH